VRHGFSTAGWDPPRWDIDVERVGRAETMTVTFHAAGQGVEPLAPQTRYGGIPGLTARYREDGVLLVLNRGANRTLRAHPHHAVRQGET
jgi:hypothetical protein